MYNWTVVAAFHHFSSKIILCRNFTTWDRSEAISFFVTITLKQILKLNLGRHE